MGIESPTEHEALKGANDFMTNEATGGASEIYSTTGCPAPHGTSGSSPPDSFHASDLNTLFGDGRVKFLNEEINIATVAALVSRNGASKEALVSQDFRQRAVSTRA